MSIPTNLLKALLFTLPVASLNCADVPLLGHGGPACTARSSSISNTPSTATISAIPDTLFFTETLTVTFEPWAPALPTTNEPSSSNPLFETASTIVSTSIPESTETFSSTSSAVSESTSVAESSSSSELEPEESPSSSETDITIIAGSPSTSTSITVSVSTSVSESSSSELDPEEPGSSKSDITSTSISASSSEPEPKEDVAASLPRYLNTTSTYPSASPTPSNTTLSSNLAAWSSYAAALTTQVSHFHATAAPSAWDAYVSRVAAMVSAFECIDGCSNATTTGTRSPFIRPTTASPGFMSTALGALPDVNATAFDGSVSHGPVLKGQGDGGHGVADGAVKGYAKGLWVEVGLIVVELGFLVLVL